MKATDSRGPRASPARTRRSTGSSTATSSAIKASWSSSDPRRCRPTGATEPQTSHRSSRAPGPRLQRGEQALADQIGVAGPSAGDVATIVDDKRVAIVVAGAAPRQLAGPELEVLGPGERRADLVFDVRRVGAVVAPAQPERREVRAALHVLRQASGAQAVEHRAPSSGLAARGDQHAVTDHRDRLERREEHN